MSDNSDSPVDRSKRPRFKEEEYDSDYERDSQDDRHPKRQAVSDPSTKAPIPSTEDKDKENDTIFLRSLVTTKDAGVIIGHGGKNVSHIRELSLARVTISEIVQGAYERVLTVSGPINAVAKAYSLIGEKILAEHTTEEDHEDEKTVQIKLLVADSKMGILIGKGGCIIKAIQESTGVRLHASEEPLPLSTERTVSIQGKPETIEKAIEHIAKLLIDRNKGITPNVVLYRPIAMHKPSRSTNNNSSKNNMYMSNNNTAVAAAAVAMGYGGMMPMPMNNFNQFYYGANGYNGGMPGFRRSEYGMVPGMGLGIGGMPSSPHAQQVLIPNDMVGCIIGKGGSKINEIRQLSGSQIKIADPQGDTRLVTITGTPESNQMALYLLYSRLESEKNRLNSL